VEKKEPALFNQKRSEKEKNSSSIEEKKKRSHAPLKKAARPIWKKKTLLTGQRGRKKKDAAKSNISTMKEIKRSFCFLEWRGKRGSRGPGVSSSPPSWGRLKKKKVLTSLSQEEKKRKREVFAFYPQDRRTPEKSPAFSLEREKKGGIAFTSSSQGRIGWWGGGKGGGFAPLGVGDRKKRRIHF